MPDSTPTNNRAAANRANAQHSTGPQTGAGKKRSSLNALRHGLTGCVIVLPSEDAAAYQRHTQEFCEEYQPKGPAENYLVQTIADTTWRLKRVTSIEAGLLTAPAATVEDLHEQTRALSNLSIYEQRLWRQFEKAVKELREIQAERREQESDQIKSDARLLEMHKEEGIPYNPADDGFVFSNDQIETYIHRCNRLDQSYEAAHRRMELCS